MALAKVEEAYKHESDTKEAIEETLRSHSFYRLLDTLDVSDEGSDENRLLPAMNKIWPFLVACIQNKNPVVSYHPSICHFSPKRKYLFQFLLEQLLYHLIHDSMQLRTMTFRILVSRIQKPTGLIKMVLPFSSTCL